MQHKHVSCDTMNERARPHLLLGHVQQADRVAVTVEVRSHRVQGLVELPLDVRQLLKHLVGRPQQQLADTQGKDLLATSGKTAYCNQR